MQARLVEIEDKLAKGDPALEDIKRLMRDAEKNNDPCALSDLLTNAAFKKIYEQSVKNMAMAIIKNNVRIYTKLNLMELLNAGVDSVNEMKNSFTPTYQEYCENFAGLGYYINSDILSTEGEANSLDMFAIQQHYWILVGNLCLKNKSAPDLNAVFQISGSLNLTPIHQVRERSRDVLLDADAEKLDLMRSLTDQQKNYSSYRQFLGENLGAIPYIGLLGKDSTFAIDGNNGDISIAISQLGFENQNVVRNLDMSVEGGFRIPQKFQLSKMEKSKGKGYVDALNAYVAEEAILLDGFRDQVAKRGSFQKPSNHAVKFCKNTEMNDAVVELQNAPVRMAAPFKLGMQVYDLDQMFNTENNRYQSDHKQVIDLCSGKSKKQDYRSNCFLSQSPAISLLILLGHTMQDNEKRLMSDEGPSSAFLAVKEIESVMNNVNFTAEMKKEEKAKIIKKYNVLPDQILFINNALAFMSAIGTRFRDSDFKYFSDALIRLEKQGMLPPTQIAFMKEVIQKIQHKMIELKIHEADSACNHAVRLNQSSTAAKRPSILLKRSEPVKEAARKQAEKVYEAATDKIKLAALKISQADLTVEEKKALFAELVNKESVHALLQHTENGMLFGELNQIFKEGKIPEKPPMPLKSEAIQVAPRRGSGQPRSGSLQVNRRRSLTEEEIAVSAPARLEEFDIERVEREMKELKAMTMSDQGGRIARAGSIRDYIESNLSKEPKIRQQQDRLIQELDEFQLSSVSRRRSSHVSVRDVAMFKPLVQTEPDQRKRSGKTATPPRFDGKK